MILLAGNLHTLDDMYGLIFTVLQLFLALSAHVNEMKTAFPSGKFVSSKVADDPEMVDSKSGMLVLYLPACCASAVCLAMWGTPPAAILTCLYLCKRVVEVLFVHVYSGNMVLPAAISSSASFVVSATLIGGVSASDPPAHIVWAGTVLFVVGAIGNLYHHVLLRRLRQRTSQYCCPRGGLFQLVAAPHYLFELIAWSGIAVTSQHLNVYVALVSMAGYLSARAKRQNTFNRATFAKEWPASRKNMVPFIF